MPPYIPFPLFMVYLSGIIEGVLGISLLFHKTQKLAAWGIISLLIAVFPANIYMAQHPDLFLEFSATALYFRLPIQGILIMWAYLLTKRSKH